MEEKSLQNRLQELETQVEQQARTIDWLTEQVHSLQSSISQRPPADIPIFSPGIPSHTPPAPPAVDLSALPAAPALATVETDWEHLLVRVWLPRIFIIVLLIGLSYGFVAAANAGLLTPPIRCLIGAGIGALLLLLGELQIRAGRTALGQVLLGGSISALVITTFSAHMLYGLISTIPAFALLLLWIIGGVVLAERHASQALSILATLGGYLVPFLLKSDHPSTTFFVAYEVLLSGAFLLLSHLRTYRVQYFLTSGLFHIAMAVFLLELDTSHEAKLFLAAGFGLHHLILLSLLLFGKRLSSSLQVGVVFTSAALTMGWWYVLLHGPSQTLYTNGLLGLAIFYAALFVVYRQDRQAKAPLFFSIAALSTMFYLLNLIDGSGHAAIALVIEAVCSLYVAYQVRNAWQKAVAVFIFAIGSLMGIFANINEVVSIATLDWLVVLAGLAVYGWLERRSVAESTHPHASYALYRLLSILLAAMLLAFLTQETTVLSRGLGPDGQHMTISFLWMLYALGVIVFGFWKKSRYVRLGGLIMLFLTLGKLVLIDLPIVSMMVRALLFIAIGALGLLISRLFYGKNTRS